MSNILRIANREIRRLFAGKIYWFCILIVPLIACFFFLSLMNEGLPTELPIAVVDLDNTSSSRNLSRQLGAFEGVKIVAQYPDFGKAQTEMQMGNIYGIFFIPRNFTQEAVSGKKPVLSFYTNNAYLIAGSLLFKDMKTASVLAAGSVALQTGRAKGYSDQQVMASLQPVVIETHPIGNPWFNYSVYLNNLLLPGILTLMIMCVTVYSIGIEIKEKTVQEWLPDGRFSITFSLIGKLLPQTILFFIVGILMYFVLYIVMQFPVNGSMALLMLALFLYIIASQALGVFMIGCLPTLRLGLSFACLFGMIAFSISGFSFPVNAMYPPVQALSNLFPLRHYFLIYVDQALNGRAFFYSWPHYLALSGFLILPAFILRNLKWSLKYVPYQA
jgi:ABC-2 type transport system permease protein